MSFLNPQLQSNPAGGRAGNLHGLDPAPWSAVTFPGEHWATADSFSMSLAMLYVILRTPLSQHQLSFARVLQLRISVTNFAIAAFCLILWHILLTLTSFDDDRLVGVYSVTHATLRVFCCTGVAGMILLIWHPWILTASALCLFAALSLFLLMLSRSAVALYRAKVRPIARKTRNVIIVGTGTRALRLAQELVTHPKWRYRLLGFVDSDPQFNGDLVLGKTETLDQVLMKRIVDEIIIALPIKSKYDEIQQAIAACERLGIQSGYSTDLFVTDVTKRRSIERHDRSSVLLHMVHDDKRRVIKRFIDISGAAAGLTALAPILVLIFLVVKFTSKGPAIFKQQRYGLNKRRFTMYKFRTMVADAEARQGELESLNQTSDPTFKLRGDPRITTVGRFLRNTSLDELPQLINVLLGDMSLVGPRPLPVRDVSLFSEAWFMRRFSVKPGLTGLWQVSGRSNVNFSQWIKLDLEYIDSWSVLLDLKILARTLPAVLRRDGAM
jgi:exopolysaccharide biosynthesis polyprenyl glycosylphosphotransferase